MNSSAKVPPVPYDLKVFKGLLHLCFKLFRWLHIFIFFSPTRLKNFSAPSSFCWISHSPWGQQIILPHSSSQMRIFSGCKGLYRLEQVYLSQTCAIAHNYWSIERFRKQISPEEQIIPTLARISSMVIIPFMPSAPLICYCTCSGVLADFWYLSSWLVGLHSNNCPRASFCLSDYHPSLGKEPQKNNLSYGHCPDWEWEVGQCPKRRLFFLRFLPSESPSARQLAF